MKEKLLRLAKSCHDILNSHVPSYEDHKQIRLIALSATRMAEKYK